MSTNLPTTRLSFSDLVYERADRRVLGALNGEFRVGEFTGVVGPNGSGKSTLLRLLYDYLEPTQGTVELDRRKLRDHDPRALACLLGVCPQEPEPSLDFPVEQALALATNGDLQAMAQAVDSLDFLALQALFGRRLSELSGGEKQKVRLARAILIEKPWLVLDEPANHLDLRATWSLMSYLQSRRDSGVVCAMHDLSLAVAFCSRLLVLDRGIAVAFGPPSEVLTEDLLAEVFGLKAQVVTQSGGVVRLEISGVSDLLERGAVH